MHALRPDAVDVAEALTVAVAEDEAEAEPEAEADAEAEADVEAVADTDAWAVAEGDFEVVFDEVRVARAEEDGVGERLSGAPSGSASSSSSSASGAAPRRGTRAKRYASLFEPAPVTYLARIPPFPPRETRPSRRDQRGGLSGGRALPLLFVP